MLVVIDYGAFEIASSNVCLKGFVDLKKYVGSVLALDACESWSARARRRRSIGSWKRCRLVAVVVGMARSLSARSGLVHDCTELWYILVPAWSTRLRHASA